MAVYVELYFHAPNMSGKSTKYIENVLYELNISLKNTIQYKNHIFTIRLCIYCTNIHIINRL